MSLRFSDVLHYHRSKYNFISNQYIEWLRNHFLGQYHPHWAQELQASGWHFLFRNEKPRCTFTNICNETFITKTYVSPSIISQHAGLEMKTCLRWIWWAARAVFPPCQGEDSSMVFVAIPERRQVEAGASASLKTLEARLWRHLSHVHLFPTTPRALPPALSSAVGFVLCSPSTLCHNYNVVFLLLLLFFILFPQFWC